MTIMNRAITVLHLETILIYCLYRKSYSITNLFITYQLYVEHTESKSKQFFRNLNEFVIPKSPSWVESTKYEKNGYFSV